MNASHPVIQASLPLIVTLIYHSCFIIAGRVLRQLISRHVSTTSPYHPFCLEAANAFQFLGCCLQHRHVFEAYGVIGFFISIYSLLMWSNIIGVISNPCGCVVQWTRGRITSNRAVALIGVQAAAAFLAYRFASVFWWLELVEGHARRRVSECRSYITVPAVLGMTSEFVGSFITFLLLLTEFTKRPRPEYAVKLFIICSIVVLGVPYTGMFMNPMNASNQTLGCHGSSVFEHLLVYWTGPLLGTYAATWLQPSLARALQRGGDKQL